MKHQPSFFKGVARVADLYGQLNHFSAASDSEALKNDWKQVGLDIMKAIKNYGQETGTHTKEK